ncbi:MAG: hypothetical protein K2V38_03520 [Gemmataceae bacterium]|nr:hypothetical protein [Gemmataceae bacterium]
MSRPRPRFGSKRRERTGRGGNLAAGIFGRRRESRAGRRNAENVAEALDGGPVRSLPSFVTAGAWKDGDILTALRRQVLIEKTEEEQSFRQDRRNEIDQQDGFQSCLDPVDFITSGDPVENSALLLPSLSLRASVVSFCWTVSTL